MRKGPAFGFNLDLLANADRADKGVNDPLARFRIAFDQPVASDKEHLRSLVNRTASLRGDSSDCSSAISTIYLASGRSTGGGTG